MVVKLTKIQLAVLSLVAITLASVIAFSGISDLPPDDHEVLVLQTTQEMHDHGDWIMPYFDGKPRLNKPPLSYWLTGIAAFLTNSMDIIQPIHGRMVSIFAGFGIAILIFLLGIKLYSPLTGIIAVFLFITSQCFFGYAHDARPEMLYAFFCTLAITFFIYSLKSPYNSSRQRNYALLLWLSFALATLTKGPQLPVMFLVAMVLYLVLKKENRESILKTIHPLAGIFIYLLLVMPWWIIVNNKLGGDGLAGTQLAGTLFKINWLNLFNGYYFYHPMWLLLPWVLFVPLLLVFVFKHYRKNENSMLLVLLYIVPCILLSLGEQQRWYYMLPAIAPLYLLLGKSIHYYLLDNKTSMRLLYKQLYISTYLCVAVSTLIWIHFQPDTSQVFSALIVVSVFMFAGIVVSWLRNTAREQDQTVIDIMVLVISFGMIISILGHTQLPWSRERFHKAYIADLSNRKLSSSTQLISWQVTPNVYMYYTHRKIPEFSSLQEIENSFNNNDEIGILLLYKNLEILRNLFHGYYIEVLNSFPVLSEKDVILVRLNRSPDKLVITSS